MALVVGGWKIFKASLCCHYFIPYFIYVYHFKCVEIINVDESLLLALSLSACFLTATHNTSHNKNTRRHTALFRSPVHPHNHTHITYFSIFLFGVFASGLSDYIFHLPVPENTHATSPIQIQRM